MIRIVARSQGHRPVKPRFLIFFQDNIDDARFPLSIISRRGIGDHFNLIDHIGLQLLQRICRRGKTRKLAVNKDTHILAAAQTYIALGIYSNRRNVLQYLGRICTLIIQIRSYIKDPFINLQRHLVLICSNCNFLKAYSSCFQVYRPEISFARLFIDRNYFAGQTEKRNRCIILTVFCGDFKAAILCRGHTGYKRRVGRTV
ncbi:hypothetical protein D9M68_607370 [compost metagenome]